MALTGTSIPNMSREQLRNQIETTFFGRRAGVDFGGYEVGENDTRTVIDNFASSLGSTNTAQGTSCNPAGVTVFSATNASSGPYTLLAPVPGVYKQLAMVTSQYTTAAPAIIQFGPNGQLVTTAGSSFNQIALGGVGHVINPLALTSPSSAGAGGIWTVTAGYPSGVVFSTY